MHEFRHSFSTDFSIDVWIGVGECGCAFLVNYIDMTSNTYTHTHERKKESIIIYFSVPIIFYLFSSFVLNDQLSNNCLFFTISNQYAVCLFIYLRPLFTSVLKWKLFKRGSMSVLLNIHLLFALSIQSWLSFILLFHFLLIWYQLLSL